MNCNLKNSKSSITIKRFKLPVLDLIIRCDDVNLIERFCKFMDYKNVLQKNERTLLIDIRTKFKIQNNFNEFVSKLKNYNKTLNVTYIPELYHFENNKFRIIVQREKDVILSCLVYSYENRYLKVFLNQNSPASITCCESIIEFYIASSLYSHFSLPLHASAVKIGDKGIIFVGESEVGKSTLALQLIYEGGKLLSNDLICLIISNDITGYCIDESIGLRVDRNNKLLYNYWSLLTNNHKPLYCDNCQTYYKAREVLGDKFIAFSKIDYVIFVEKVPISEPKIKRLNRKEALYFFFEE